jgi:hypothetical protein
MTEPGVGPGESTSYARLLALVTHPRDPASTASSRQFAIVRQTGASRSERAFTSRFHML